MAPSQPISFSLRRKKAKLEELLLDRSVFIRISLQHPGVMVPEEFRSDPLLVLRISFHFRTPLVLLDDRLEQELVFGENYFRCIIPYEALLFATNEAGKSFDFTSIESDVEPKEIPKPERLLSSESPEGASSQQNPSTETSGAKGYLKRVK